MGEQKQKTSEEFNSEALMMGGTCFGALALLIKFLVPVTVALVLSPLIFLGWGATAGKGKILF
jgi:hypothetical protein